ncbi:MAG TPA: transporter substrate-binding domain-containing protein [Anaerolineales bacterium]
MKLFKLVSVLIVAAMVVSACASATTAAPTTAPVTNTSAPAPTTPPQATATSAPTMAPATATVEPTASPTITPTMAAPTPVAQVPDGATQQKSKLLICTDFPYPPQEFFDDNGAPQGMDVEIGFEIGKRLGLQVEYVNSIFDTIIAAVTAGKCDIIISAMNITPDRNKQVSMIPYFNAGQAFVVQKGNPSNIKTQDDLCGQSVAAESGTTEAFYLSGTDTYTGKGLTQECTKAGKKPITVVVTQKDTDALQQLQTGKVVAYFADSPVAAYYTVQHPDQFELVPVVLNAAEEGINLPCGQADCTKAPLTPLGAAIKTALQSMMTDGTYLKILQKWNLQDGAVKLQ